jgi:hypothetical protein
MSTGGASEVVSAPIGDLTKWHFVAGTFNGTELKIYVDGKLSASKSYSGTMPITNNATFGIGDDDVGGRFWGKIDDVRVYAIGISSYDVRSLYAEGYAKHLALEGN